MRLDTIHNQDCLKGMRELPDNSIDLIATDPPYGISFMGRAWDRAIPLVDIWREALRVLKPGAFAFVMCIPRQDCLARMVVSLEEAGFKISFTSMYWAVASGFPKAQNIGKAVDKRKGHSEYGANLVEIIRQYLDLKRKEKGLTYEDIDKIFGFKGKMSGPHWFSKTSQNMIPRLIYWEKLKNILDLDGRFDDAIKEAERKITGKDRTRSNVDNIPFVNRGEFDRKDTPATLQAQALDGSYGGFQPKPAVEIILVAMKPLSEKTYVDQALRNRKGVTWLDEGRIPYETQGDIEKSSDKNRHADFGSGPRDNKVYGADKRNRAEQGNYDASKGRFPANLLASDDALNDGRIQKSSKLGKNCKSTGGFNNEMTFGKTGTTRDYPDSGSFSRYFSLDAWFAKKLTELPKGVQRTFPFLIVPKASKAEKNRGCKKNIHATVKPIKLMSYLITLGSRPGDVVLDPFIGSGTTAIAARMLRRRYIGYETDSDYCRIAEARLAAVGEVMI